MISKIITVLAENQYLGVSRGYDVTMALFLDLNYGQGVMYYISPKESFSMRFRQILGADPKNHNDFG